MDTIQRIHERANALGEAEAGARLIAQRVRSGQLGRTWVHLLYLLGDPAAACYLAAPPPRRPDEGLGFEWFSELAGFWGDALLEVGASYANELLRGTPRWLPLPRRQGEGRDPFESLCLDVMQVRGVGRAEARAVVTAAMAEGVIPWARLQSQDPSGLDPRLTAVLCWLSSGRYPERSRALLRQLGLSGLRLRGYYETELAMPRGLGDYAQALEVRFGAGVEGAAAACTAAQEALGDWAPIQEVLDALERLRQGEGSAEALMARVEDLPAVGAEDTAQAAIVEAVRFTCAAALGPAGWRASNVQQAILGLAEALGEGRVGDAIERVLFERAIAGALVFDDVAGVCETCAQAPCAEEAECPEDGIETSRFDRVALYADDEDEHETALRIPRADPLGEEA